MGVTFRYALPFGQTQRVALYSTRYLMGCGQLDTKFQIARSLIKAGAAGRAGTYTAAAATLLLHGKHNGRRNVV